MNNLQKYTKYQKKVIKFLGLLLDNDRPFYYEKTKNNHLQVKIKGVQTVLHTGGTPSDIKSYSNFKAEVKRALKAADQTINQTSANSMPLTVKCIEASLCTERLVSSIIKQFRKSRDTLIFQEKQLIGELGGLDRIKTFRAEKIKRLILSTHKQQKNNGYLKTKQLNTITKKISKYVDFILPTLAHYKVNTPKNKNILSTKKKEKELEIIVNETENLNTHSTHELINCIEPDTSNTEVSQIKRETVFSNASSQDELQHLLSANPVKRMNILRKLSKSESLTLIDEINQSLALNQEQSIEEVLAFIKDKNIPATLLIQHLNNAA